MHARERRRERGRDVGWREKEIERGERRERERERERERGERRERNVEWCEREEGEGGREMVKERYCDSEGETAEIEAMKRCAAGTREPYPQAVQELADELGVTERHHLRRYWSQHS
jgi:hypothetical protein